MGLAGVLRARSGSLFGIVNGVDYSEWDPATDRLIPHRYTPENLEPKRRNTEELLRRFELEPAGAAPVLGIVSRLTFQKGFELVSDSLPVLLHQHDVRLVVLGSGEERYERYFHWLRETFPRRVGFHAGYDNQLAHWIEAGADMFLMPSRYEPCGLNQMYSLKYGTVPVVRRTGGLADTVEPFQPATGKGTGFVFDNFTAHALLDAVLAALATFRDPPLWRQLMRNGMAKDFSWDHQGRRYVELYQRLLG
jgi:starch synthase